MVYIRVIYLYWPVWLENKASLIYTMTYNRSHVPKPMLGCSPAPTIHHSPKTPYHIWRISTWRALWGPIEPHIHLPAGWSRIYASICTHLPSKHHVAHIQDRVHRIIAYNHQFRPSWHDIPMLGSTWKLNILINITPNDVFTARWIEFPVSASTPFQSIQRHYRPSRVHITTIQGRCIHICLSLRTPTACSAALCSYIYHIWYQSSVCCCMHQNPSQTIVNSSKCYERSSVWVKTIYNKKSSLYSTHNSMYGPVHSSAPRHCNRSSHYHHTGGLIAAGCSFHFIPLAREFTGAILSNTCNAIHQDHHERPYFHYLY